MAKKFLIPQEQERVVKAIESAELNTSGEIRVHIESFCSGDSLERAIYIFEKIGMHKTVQRNGVLIYIAFRSHKLAIIGDDGINSKVAENFWQQEIELLSDYIKKGKAADGLMAVIEAIGNRLNEIFPHKEGDINEQSNEISFGE